jgi:tRNA-splicing ligase RtcB
MPGARPGDVSARAKKRQQDEMGTLGSGNHYLEVQHVVEVFDPGAAEAFDIQGGDVVISIHCGSRGMGHQIGTDFLKIMLIAAQRYGIGLVCPSNHPKVRRISVQCAPVSIVRWPIVRFSLI